MLNFKAKTKRKNPKRKNQRKKNQKSNLIQSELVIIHLLHSLRSLLPKPMMMIVIRMMMTAGTLSIMMIQIMKMNSLLQVVQRILLVCCLLP